MNSSPPPPSFTLPPLTSSGQFPVTPSPTPSPTEKDGFEFKSPKGKGKGKARETYDQDEAGGRISMYVKLFEEMIETVLEHESYLFTPREVFVLRSVLSLPYEPKYLLTRLLLRRPGKIHPLASLLAAYSPELGEAGVQKAADRLSEPLATPFELLESEPDALPQIPSSRPVTTPLQPTRSYPTPSTSTLKPRARRKPWSSLPTGLTEDEEKADPQLAEALRESLWASKVGRVEVDEDGSVVESPPLQRSTPSRSNSTTSSSISPPSHPLAVMSEEFSLTPRPPNPISVLARDETRMTIEEIMTCVTADELRKLARARKVPTSTLITRESTVSALKALATRQTTLSFAPIKASGKRVNTAQQGMLPFTPSKSITSESLLINSLLPILGHRAIQLTAELHSLVARVNLIFSRTPPLTSTSSSLMLPSILVFSHKRRYPDYGPPTRSRIWSSRDELLRWERAVHWESIVADCLGETWAEQRKNPTPGFGVRKEIIGRVEGAKVVKRIWEGVWPIWKDLVLGDRGKEVDVRREEGGLVGDRFKTGHVLTRIIYKGAVALGILHEYDLECEVLRALLVQRRWRRGRRGAWYDRLALVLMNHYNASPEEKEEKRRDATQVCIDGLLDEDTHLIYRPGLSRRLTRLENKLNLPADERHISHAELHKSTVRELAAPRVPENMGAPRMRPRSDSIREREASLRMDEEGLEQPTSFQQTGKSVWVGREGEVTVEGWVLEWWEDKGYKGYHSEGSIVTTLFALLLWPVLFHPLPGAFETPYQTAPLDLGEDTFAPARSDLLEERLEAMNKTDTALQMLRETDCREREKATWAVGLNWEYQREDLEELVQCLGGNALSGICRMLGEEYRHRVSGVPDLIVWNFDKREARFIEVKGPGDSLSETQKVWIDVLLSAGVPVEVCKVKAKDPEASRKAMERLAKRQKTSRDGMPSKLKKEDTGDWSGLEEEADEEDEWKYESGEEGKAEGRWEKPVGAKRAKSPA